ncbi:hypothetical protein VPHK436_0003 [Vibrio phage K436]
MTNALKITEVTLAEAADSTNAVNTVGYWDRAHVIRITDHASNDTAETGSDTDKMAIFERKALGHPWERRGTTLVQKIWNTVTPATDAIPKDVSTLFPDWDYSDFE